MNNDKLDLRSPDITQLNTEKIAALFPNCVTETAEGKKIDFDLLKQELSSEIVEGTKERYRLEWPGKKEAIVTANMPTDKTLRPVREASVDFDTTENIYIEGDNLEVLKLLQESYLGKIKMIYIDPPYNTGKDFVYKDNFAKDGDAELLESGQKDEYNQRLVANPETSGRYHSDWLSMIYPRLKLARNLLTDDGVIFVSIDDNEVHNLRKICDEIFGENNLAAQIVWQARQSIQNDTDISESHEYILAYARNRRQENRRLKESNSKIWYQEPSFAFYPKELDESKFDNLDNDSRGKWKADPFDAPNLRPNLTYPITNPNNGEVYMPPIGRCWRTGEEEYKKLLSDNRIIFGKTGNSKPQLKVFYNEKKEFGSTIDTWFDGNKYGTATKGTKVVQNLFEGKSPFDTVKPVELIENILKFSIKNTDTILDFFSGSATTAHAVMQLNAEDGGKRKYFMVQLPELVDNQDYKNICEIGEERIRRAAKKIKEEKAEKAKKDGMFEDFKDEQDYGFRVYRLDSSNMQDVYYKPQDVQQSNLDLFADNVKPDRSAEDLLAQIMLDWGLPLSLKIERKTMAGKEVFCVAGNSLYACFDTGVEETFAKELANDQPLRIVFRDKGFKDDTAKENVKQLLKQLSPDTEMKVI